MRTKLPPQFRRRLLAALLLLLATTPLGTVVASEALRVTDTETKAWPNKTVVLTARSPARFMAYTRPKMSFGLLGIAMARLAGKKLIEENGVENSAPQIAETLLRAAENHYRVTAASLAPLMVESDAANIARMARGADLVFDVQPTSASLEPLLTKPGKYFVTSVFRFRVIDVASGRVLGDDTCVRSTQTQPHLSTYDELVKDHATRLKIILADQRDFCAKYFETQVLGMEP